MKYKLIISICLLFLLITISAYAGNLSVRGDILWTPPGYDMITGNYVNVAQGTVGTTLQVHPYFRFHYDLILDMVTHWQSPEERGHGFQKYTTSYALKPEKTLHTSQFKADFGPENLYVYLLYRVPHDRHNLEGWGGAGHDRSTEYYGGIGLHVEHDLLDW